MTNLIPETERLRTRAFDLLLGVTPEEVTSWKTNPITFALILNLTADSQDIKNGFVDDVLVDLYRMAGKAACCEEVLTWIDNPLEGVKEYD